MLAGIYIKRTRAVLFALHRQCTCGVDSVDINFIVIRTVLRRRRTAADDSVFRAVCQNNGCAVGQFDCGRCRGDKRNAVEREGLGAVVPRGVCRACFGSVQQVDCRRAAVRGGEVCRFVGNFYQLCRQCHIACDGTGEVIRHIAVVPDHENMTVLCGVIRLQRRCAAGQNLHGVILAIDPIGHGATADHTALGDTAIEHTAADRTAVSYLSFKDTAGDRIAVDYLAVKGTVGNRAMAPHRTVKKAAVNRAADISIHGFRL